MVDSILHDLYHKGMPCPKGGWPVLCKGLQEFVGTEEALLA